MPRDQRGERKRGGSGGGVSEWPNSHQAQARTSTPDSPPPLPGAKGPGLSVTTTTFVTRLQSLASRSLHMAARSAQMEPPIVLDSAFVPVFIVPSGIFGVFFCFGGGEKTKKRRGARHSRQDTKRRADINRNQTKTFCICIYVHEGSMIVHLSCAYGHVPVRAMSEGGYQCRRRGLQDLTARAGGPTESRRCASSRVVKKRSGVGG